jgi:hypothetical protein
MTNREEAASKIDAIRATLDTGHTCEDPGADWRKCRACAAYNAPALVSIVRDLHDGYPLADVRAAAAQLSLADYDAQRSIRAIVAGISE